MWRQSRERDTCVHPFAPPAGPTKTQSRRSASCKSACPPRARCLTCGMPTRLRFFSLVRSRGALLRLRLGAACSAAPPAASAAAIAASFDVSGITLEKARSSDQHPSGDAGQADQAPCPQSAARRALPYALPHERRRGAAKQSVVTGERARQSFWGARGKICRHEYSTYAAQARKRCRSRSAGWRLLKV